MNVICRWTALLTLLVGLAGCSTTPSPIDIGHVSDKTRLDKAGDHAEFGLRLALSELTTDETLAQTFGGRKIQVRHTDARGQLDAFESQAVRLDSVNRCLALLGGVSPAETSSLNNAKVPLLTFHGQAPAGANHLVFYLGMTPDRQGTVLAKMVAGDAKASRITILMDEKRPEAVAVAEAFHKEVVATNKDVKVLTLRCGADPKSTRLDENAKWQDVIERMRQHDTQTVVFAGAVQDFNAWHKFADVMPQIIFAGPDGAHRLFDLTGDTTEVLLATAFDPAADKAAPFVKAYRGMHHAEADVHAALAYDGLRILVDAMKRTPTQLTSEKIREELLKTKDFEGLTGPLTITTDRQITRPLFVMSWKSGSLKSVKTFAP